MKNLFLLTIFIFSSLSSFGQLLEDLGATRISVIEGKDLPSCGKGTIITEVTNLSIDLNNDVLADYDNSQHYTMISTSIPQAFDLSTTVVTITSQSGQTYWKPYTVDGRTINIELIDDAVIMAGDIITIKTVSEIKDDQDYTGQLIGLAIQHAFFPDDNSSDDRMIIDQAAAITTDSNATCAPLPVEIAAFEVSTEGSNAVLDWSTSSEVNNSHFEVERSFDGVSFEQVGKVTGNGTSNEVNNYSFVDHNVNSTIAYYKLKQVDYNGDYAYSDVKHVRFDLNNNLSVYPNPFSSKINLDIKGYEGELNVTVTNANGKTVKVIKSASKQLDLDSLARGTYMLTVTDNNNNLLVNNKIVKIQ